MLYDKRWDKQIETKPEPLSLAGLVAWLETQNPMTTYRYTNIDDCLVIRYVRSLGYKDAWGATGYRPSFNYSPWGILPSIFFMKRIPVEMLEIANGGFYRETYGAALERARKLLTTDQRLT